MASIALDLSLVSLPGLLKLTQMYCKEYQLLKTYKTIGYLKVSAVVFEDCLADCFVRKIACVTLLDKRQSFHERKESDASDTLIVLSTSTKYRHLSIHAMAVLIVRSWIVHPTLIPCSVFHFSPNLARLSY